MFRTALRPRLGETTSYGTQTLARRRRRSRRFYGRAQSRPRSRSRRRLPGWRLPCWRLWLPGCGLPWWPLWLPGCGLPWGPLWLPGRELPKRRLGLGSRLGLVGLGSWLGLELWLGLGPRVGLGLALERFSTESMHSARLTPLPSRGWKYKWGADNILLRCSISPLFYPHPRPPSNPAPAFRLWVRVR